MGWERRSGGGRVRGESVCGGSGGVEEGVWGMREEESGGVCVVGEEESGGGRCGWEGGEWRRECVGEESAEESV